MDRQLVHPHVFARSAEQETRFFVYSCAPDLFLAFAHPLAVSNAFFEHLLAMLLLAVANLATQSTIVLAVHLKSVLVEAQMSQQLLAWAHSRVIS